MVMGIIMEREERRERRRTTHHARKGNNHGRMARPRNQAPMTRATLRWTLSSSSSILPFFHRSGGKRTLRDGLKNRVIYAADEARLLC
jgi:hypothetical protein